MDNESISGDPQHNTPSNGGVSRRSLMKAGAHAAWAIPMVQVVAAAPAIALSGAPVLSLTSTANYGTSVGASTADPTHLFVTTVVKNTGGATTGLKVTLTIPANLYDTAPTVSTSTGWSATPASGSLAAGWTIVLNVVDQVAAGASSPSLTATLTLNDTVAWRKFDGAAFNLTVAASASNPGAQSASTVAPVAAAPTAAATLTINRFVAAYKNKTTFTVGVQSGNPSSRTTVKAAGATSSVGPINLTVRIPKTTSAPFDARPSSNGNANWTLSPSGSDTSTHWGYVFSSDTKIAPNSESPNFDATFTYPASAATPTVTVTCDAAGDRANAAQVTATAP